MEHLIFETFVKPELFKNVLSDIGHHDLTESVCNLGRKNHREASVVQKTKLFDPLQNFEFFFESLSLRGKFELL